MSPARWTLTLPARWDLRKVPEITAYFWILKVLTTAMGEATSDYLAHHYNPYLVVPLGGVALVLTLAWQLSTRRYITGVYWFAVVMVAIVGTMVADALHIQFKVPYYQSSAFFAVTLTLIFAAWYRSERTLSIHSIYTRRREMYYWATVLATFALGTAAGDLTARTLGLGFFSAGILFAVVIAIPAIAHWRFGMNPILAFWFAYIVTRPLGASFADWMGISHTYGGLGLGYGTVSLFLTVLIVGFVAYLGATGKDVEERAGAATRSGRHRQQQPAPQRGRLQPAPLRVVNQVEQPGPPEQDQQRGDYWRQRLDQW